ncbi:uncharacterized protein LOC125234849 [Leguminivora glycinivorella]|uniref:uncharacterized protein LOC125234849 n=1 Tax=Leguminivora glycinivorella TaxID=1035111 RepID=UPI00200BA5A4|nr:uncharacterized protein LOC125234849 [Leguminivora glycinivorella]
MTFFTLLLFTIHIISSTVASLQCPYECQPNEANQEVHCVEIDLKGGGVSYTKMFGCAMNELKCYAGNEATLTSVEMSLCTPSKRVKRSDPNEKNVIKNIKTEADDYQVTESMRSHNERCPLTCPPSEDMVCIRFHDGVYRTFMSDCYMRMYQCHYPDQKMELVKRHACYGSAPYMMFESKQQENANALHDEDLDKGAKKKNWMALAAVIHERDYWTRHHQTPRTPKPTVHVTWPSRRTKTKSTTTMPPSTSKPLTKESTTPSRAMAKEASVTTSTQATSTTSKQATTSTTSPVKMKEDVDAVDDVERIDVDICPNDEDQDTPVEVPDTCSKTSIKSPTSSDYMKVDLHPDIIEDGSPVWMVFNGGKKITSKIRADAGMVVGCDAYAGLDYYGNVVVRNKADNDFFGFVFGYRSNSQFYLVTWKAKSDKYWIGYPYVVTADAGLHIKVVNSSTGPGAFLRNALYSTESIKDQVTLLWQDPKKQGWKHLVLYSWQLLHRPHIGLIRVKVFRGGKLIVDSGNVYDKTIKGGRIGVYAFSQENIEWTKMKFVCNDKVPTNLMSELSPDLQKISVADSTYTWNNISWP